APRVPEARFYVVGALLADPVTAVQVGDERGRLERLAAELGARERISFTGVRRDVPTVMAGLDVFVLASHAEPFGLVVLEAMALGVAVVATGAGGPAEVVEPGVSGLLVPPRDPPALAAAIERLAGDPELRRRLGSGGDERGRRGFT